MCGLNHLGTVRFAVFKADGAGLLDGAFELLEHLLFAVQVFVVVTTHQQRVLDAAVQHVSQKVGGQPRVQTLQTGQAGKTLHIGHAEDAHACSCAHALVVERIHAVFLFQFQEGKTLVQVTLDGAQVHAKFCDQCMRVQLLAFVEAAQDFGQPEGDGVSGGGLGGHGGGSGALISVQTSGLRHGSDRIGAPCQTMSFLVFCKFI